MSIRAAAASLRSFARTSLEAVPMRWRVRVAELRGRGPYAGYADDHRAIFIHVPKTAGQSVAVALFGAKAGLVDHVPYFTYQWADPKKFARYWKFAVVRNPWDRVVSAYAYMSLPNHRRFYARVHGPDIAFSGDVSDFDIFVRKAVSEKSSTFARTGFYPLLSQSYFLLDSSGKLMVDFLGRYETLSADFEKISGELGMTECVLPRLNASNRGDFRSYYTSDTWSIVERVYARDIAEFGYAAKASPSDLPTRQRMTDPAVGRQAFVNA